MAADAGLVAKCSDAEQCCWHILHPHRRPWSVNGHLASRIRLQVEKANRPTKGCILRVPLTNGSIFSLPGVAMPKGLYFTAVVFSFFIFDA